MRRFALVPVFGVLACFSETEDGGGALASESSTAADTSTTVDVSTSVGSQDGSSSDSGVAECDPEAVADGVFASASSGDDVAGDGTAMRPVATIGVAITIALATEQRTIYLDESVYEEAVLLPDAPLGLVIEGGWVRVGAQWSIDCSDDVVQRTIIAAPPSSSFVVEANGVVHPSALRRMTLATKASGASPDDASGESIYGVRVLGEGSVLALEDIVVDVGDGGEGGVASEGIVGTAGPLPDDDKSCDGLVCDDGGTGAAGGIAGAPAAMPGSFDEVGFVPSDGAPGNDGGEGRAGTSSPSGPQSASNCVSGCTCHNDSVCSSDGNVGLAGGPGRCGCGGGGGGGGAAGRGGGATVALFVSGANATVSVVRAQLSSGNGGAGSQPGEGGAGGAGSLGVEGGSTSCFTGCSTGGGPCENCYSSGETMLEGGAAGGVGGSGGSGSAGGAGAGGDAWSVVLVGGAKLIASDDVVLVHGDAGIGAGSGAAKAPDGQAGDVLELE